LTNLFQKDIIRIEQQQQQMMDVRSMEELKKLPQNFEELSLEDIIWINDHVFGNIFVCNGDGKIIFVNESTAKTFGLTKEQTLSLNTRDIMGNGIINRSTTLEALEKREAVIGSFKSRNGQEYFAISTPLLDEEGNVSLVMTYSQEKSLMTTFFDVIEKEQKRADKYKRAYSYMATRNNDSKDIIIKNQTMQQLFDFAQRIAKTDSTVLIVGETGTGKDVMAEFIHNNSFRKSETFIPVNCSAIPAALMESEFFGYEKGAFTGAQKDGKSGLFEVANEGTLFLDEIGELSLSMQAKLLRVLETRTFYRVGGTKAHHTDARLLAATNRDLQEMVRRKTFREDLYYRLNVIPIEIPPLRERPEDIVPLAEYFLAKLNKKYSLRKEFSPEILKEFIDYSWPGNIRELKNIIERLVITSSHNLLTQSDIGNINDLTKSNNIQDYYSEKNNPSLIMAEDTLESRYKKIEEQKVIDALIETKGNKSKAAKLLGISTGKLYRILRNRTS
jgi:transcriptional regulator with PAS, ATPase and Fis domain